VDYYVDNSGADGDGSIGNPWNNIAGHTADLSAGDTMHVRGDSPGSRIYVESPIVCEIVGSSGSRVTLKAYTGEGVTIKTPGANHSISLRANYWTLDGLDFDKDYIGHSQIQIRAANYAIIQNCDLAQSGGDGAIYFAGGYTTTNTLIDNCIIRDTFKTNVSDSHGILIAGTRSGITISNCTIYDIRGDGICALGGEPVTTVTVEDCHLYTTIGKCSENGCDFKSGDPTIRDCVFNGFRYCDGTCGGNGGGIGAALVIQNDVTDCLVEDNEFYDCESGIAVGEFNGGTIQKNLFYEFVPESPSPAWLAAAVWVSWNDGLEIHDNTFHDMPEYLYRLSSTATNIEFRNNLAYDTNQIGVSEGASYDSDYNGWFDCTDTLVGAHDTTGSGDPGFVNAAGDDYTLLATSVCIDKGVDVGLPYNGTAPDLGYAEYEGGAGLITLGLALGVGFSATVTWASPPPETAAGVAGAAYKLRFYSPAGVLVAETTDFGVLAYTKRVNIPGLLKFNMRGDHGSVALLENRSQIEVWRRNERRGLDWHCDFYGLYLSQERQYAERNIFTAYCPGQMWLLATRIIAWYTETTNRTVFTGIAAETIMKTLVDYNACANATMANGRLREGAITGLSIQTDGAAGNTLSWKCAYKNLLVELQDLAMAAGGDFDLIKTAAQAWEFRWYTGQRGADRRSTVIFAHERGNMANPRYHHGRINEKTVAVVGGQGEEDERDTRIMLGDDYSVSNDIETFVDARTRTSPLGLQDAGNERLNKLRARERFTWEVVQAPACFYGQVISGGDYELGDLVTARAFGIEKEHKISGVTVTVAPSSKQFEVIDIEIETPVTAP